MPKPPSPPELVAPAGSPDAGYAALAYGADAIYLGLHDFSARADATNFSADELDEITAYAHSLTPRRRVYVTVNTLILDKELPQLVETLAFLEETGIDAVVVQDWGTVEVAQKHFPGLRLHASTQMAAHNRAGVEALAEAGFKRVILARELTLDEIRGCAAVPGVEIEVFVHGALCYSVSGLCLFSSFETGRSGNRGRCAQCCRDRFFAPGASDAFLPFSMKDLALGDCVAELRDAGVAALKIEGRKRNALYVAAVANYYRKLLAGGLSNAQIQEAEADLQTIFSRPWTGLYLRGRKNTEAVDSEITGHRGVEIGEAEGVRRIGRQYWLRFTTSRRIERHDGIQIEVPGRNRLFGFAVADMHLAGGGRGRPRPVFEAEAGSRIEVLLPDGHPEIPEGAPVLLASSQAVKQKYPFEKPKVGEFKRRVRVDVEVEVGTNGLCMTVRQAGAGDAESVCAAVSMDASLQHARDPALTDKAAKEAWSRTGDTRLSVERLSVANPKKLFVPVSLMNELRRRAAVEFEARLADMRRSRIQAIAESVAASSGAGGTPGEPLWSVKADRLETLAGFEPPDWQGIEEFVIELPVGGDAGFPQNLAQLADMAGRERIRIALPVLVREWEETATRAQVERLMRDGWRKWEISNPYGWRMLNAGPSDDLDISTDWPVYVLNRAAARRLLAMGVSRFTLSPEDGFENIRQLVAEFSSRAVLSVYIDAPLFISDTCLQANLTGRCPGPGNCTFDEMELISQHRQTVTALSRNCRTVVISAKPFCIADRLDEITRAGGRHFRACFVNRRYEPEEAQRIWRLLREGRCPPNTQRANFDRGLL
jgi:putative protease